MSLLATVTVQKQRFRGRDWYVLRDGFTQRFFRITPQAYAFIARLDPSKTVEQAWLECLADMPDQAPGQEEVIQLLSQLHQSNLLYFDTKADSEIIFDRYRDFRRKEFHGKLLSFLSIRIPLWDPNDWLNRHLRWINALISWPMAAVAGLLMLAGVWIALANLDVLLDRSSGIFALDNLLWLYACMAAMKVIHELGHAFVVKRFGGDVHGMGLMFLVLVPLPYVDATGSWKFRSRGAKALAGAIGILVELVLAALASVVWVNTGAGLVNSLAFNVMVLGTVSSLIFNGNPLLRFDAYYVMSDLLGIPNMYQKASQQWTYFGDKYLLGTPNVESPATDSREWWWLTLYGLISYVYRTLVFISIWMLVMDKWVLLGVVFGVTSLFIMLGVPLYRLSRHLSSPAITRNRRRALSVSIGLTVVPLILLATVPVPDAIRAPGVLESVSHTRVTTEVGGILEELQVPDGAVVRRGDVLLRLRNFELELDIEAAQALVQEVLVTRDLALVKSPVEVAALNERLSAVQDRLQLLLNRQQQLVIRASHDGIWVRTQLHIRQGNWVARGAPLGELTSSEQGLRFSAVVSQELADELFKNALTGAEVKLNGQAAATLNVSKLVLLPYQRRTLQTSALGWSGGGTVPVKQDDPEGVKTLEPYYEVLATVGTAAQPAHLIHGVTGWLRVPIQSRPLLIRWYKAIRQLVQKRYQF